MKLRHREYFQWIDVTDLHVLWYGLKGLLYDPTAVHLQGQGQHVTPQPLGQGLLLLRRAKLEKLLDDVVAKHVCHKAVGGRQDLVKHHGLLLGRGTLKLLLDKPATANNQSFNSFNT